MVVFGATCRLGLALTMGFGLFLCLDIEFQSLNWKLWRKSPKVQQEQWLRMHLGPYWDQDQFNKKTIRDGPIHTPTEDKTSGLQVSICHQQENPGKIDRGKTFKTRNNKMTSNTVMCTQLYCKKNKIKNKEKCLSKTTNGCIETKKR